MTEYNDTIDFEEVESDNIENNVAPKGLRFANYIIDSLASLIPASMITNYVFTGKSNIFSEPHGDVILAAMFQYLLYVCYYFFFENFAGKTLGKAITRSKVVNSEMEPASVNQLLGRSFARLIPFEAFSFLGEKGIGWHDS